MAHPIVNYNGEDITCYPGSNQQDEGKLNLEFNMARFVTRVSSKNFCIVKPSFELSLINDISTGEPLIRMLGGQCSINGMDLIMSNSITIGAPDGIGKWYLAFKLARDSSKNVLGDLVYGSTRTFKGVYLTYFDEKPDPVTDPDIFYLGSVEWDGTQFSNLEEDEDKYGRIWAEDILCKFLDPKHPDVRRLNLQEYIYKIPDWYFSKEGDTIYGPLSIVQDRDNPQNTGILMNVDETGTHITIKNPEVNNNLLQFYGDVDRDGSITVDDVRIIQAYIDGTGTLTDLQKKLADVNHDGEIDEKDIEYITNFINQDPKNNWGDTGNIYFIDNSVKDINIDVEGNTYKWSIGKGSIYESESDDKMHIHNDGAICIDAEGPVTIEGDSEISLSTENANSPKLTLDDNNIKIIDPNAPNLIFNFTFTDANTAKFTLGKAIWQYNNSTQVVSLLSNDVNYLQVSPKADFLNDVRAKTTLYIGNENTYGTEKTFLKSGEWQLSNSGKTIYTNMTPGTITEINPTADSGYVLVQNAASNPSSYSKLFNSGKLRLVNTTTQPRIQFGDSNTSYDVQLYKTIGAKTLNLDGALSTNNTITASGLITGNGLKTSSGVVTFTRGSGDATITKDNNATNLRTSGNFYVGSSGNMNLYAGTTTLGNTTINGTLTGTGNWTTTGTITGSKVYNAVYNDYAEVFEKDRDEVIEPGDIVCIREDGLVHRVENMSDLNSIVGICSNTEGVLLGGAELEDDQKCIVGLVGKIWVRTNNPYLIPGEIVKALPDGTVDYTNIKEEKFGVVMSTVNEEGKVKIVYNG